MSELQELVRRFVGGALSYQQFRHAFAPLFLVAEQDGALGRACLVVESHCSAFEHGILDENGLRLGLAMNVAWVGVSSSTINTARVVAFIDPMGSPR